MIQPIGLTSVGQKDEGRLEKISKMVIMVLLGLGREARDLEKESA